jgi:acyl-CoA oxidase
MRWAQVAADGSYSKPPLKQITYNSLISGRVDMVRFSSHAVQKAVTIAIRYGCVRRQFPLHGAEQGDDADAAGVAHSKPAPAAVATAGGGLLEERKLMDYQTHQLRLIPLLAGAYALHFAAAIVIADFQNFQSNLAKEGALDRLGEIHATAAGLKAVATWYANDAIEHCRQCLGGNGYSAYSELPAHRADWAVMCTWEGDNTVMMKQCARFLVKQHRKRAGSIDAAGRRAMALDFDPRSSAAQVAALQHVANRLIAEAAQSNEEVDLVRAARAHCNLVIVQSFGQGVREAPAPCRDVLKRLCDLHACVLLEQSASELQEDGYATGRHVAAVRRAVRLLCAELRPEAVGLVDAFGIPDFILGPFGARDGKIYERFFAQVTSVPGSQDRPPYWEELIKPLTSAPPTSS